MQVETIKRRRGPRLKSEREKLRHCVSVMLTDEQLERLNVERRHIQKGAYLRQSWLGSVKPVVPEFNRQAYSELARSAANLNQISVKLKMGHSVLMIDVQDALRHFRLMLRGAAL